MEVQKLNHNGPWSFHLPVKRHAYHFSPRNRFFYGGGVPGGSGALGLWEAFCGLVDESAGDSCAGLRECKNVCKISPVTDWAYLR